MSKKFISYFIISIFTLLYFATSIVSTIHVVDFFLMTNSIGLAISLAVAFELGAAASLASIVSYQKMNKVLIWSLFIVLTLFQAMGNVYYSYASAHDFQNFVELFGLTDFSVIAQKRILSLLSGAILPLVALGYIKSLVDYIKPSDTEPKKVKDKKDDFDDFFEEKPRDIVEEMSDSEVDEVFDDWNKDGLESDDFIEAVEKSEKVIEPEVKKSEEVSSQQSKSVEKTSNDDTTVNKNKPARKKNVHIKTTKKNPK